MQGSLHIACLGKGTKASNVETIEKSLTDVLFILTEYFVSNSFNANPGKTNVCAFHFKNHIPTTELNKTGNGSTLQNERQFPCIPGHHT